MTKKRLESRFGKERIFSEEAIFREYMAYVKGDLPDEFGERGRRIISNADTISRVLGYQDIQSWINSYNLTSKNSVKDNLVETIEKLREDYNQLSRLGYNIRDMNRAISIIETNRDLYGIENGSSLFLKSYKEKKRIISQAKKCYERVLSQKKEDGVRI